MTAASILTTADRSPDAPEKAIARDLVKRGLPVAPVLIGICAAIWGVKGAESAAFAVAIVLVNFVLAAWLVGVAARISLAFLMAATLFGYVLRLGLITLAVMVVRHQSWVKPYALGLTLVITHLGLLAWETKYISATLAFPGLKPSNKPSRSQQA